MRCCYHSYNSPFRYIDNKMKIQTGRQTIRFLRFAVNTTYRKLKAWIKVQTKKLQPVVGNHSESEVLYWWISVQRHHRRSCTTGGYKALLIPVCLAGPYTEMTKLLTQQTKRNTDGNCLILWELSQPHSRRNNLSVKLMSSWTAFMCFKPLTIYATESIFS